MHLSLLNHKPFLCLPNNKNNQHNASPMYNINIQKETNGKNIKNSIQALTQKFLLTPSCLLQRPSSSMTLKVVPTLCCTKFCLYFFACRSVGFRRYFSEYFLCFRVVFLDVNAFVYCFLKVFFVVSVV